MSLKLRANSKINLTLNITGKREDGYHTISSVMMPVSLADTVVLEKSADISVSCNLPSLPCGKSNTAFRAAALFMEENKIQSGVRIYIEKHIPLGGGLGGSSADAAAVLKGLNLLYGTELSETRLCHIGAQIGADVPLLICGKTCLCEGVGELLTPLDVKQRLNLVICYAGEGINTGFMYSCADKTPFVPKSSDKIKELLTSGELDGIKEAVFNDFEPICLSYRPKVAFLKAALYQNGALAASMSGSGVSVFGIFKNEAAAKKAVAAIKSESDCFAVFAENI